MEVSTFVVLSDFMGKINISFMECLLILRLYSSNELPNYNDLPSPIYRGSSFNF